MFVYVFVSVTNEQGSNLYLLDYLLSLSTWIKMPKRIDFYCPSSQIVQLWI